MSPPFIMLMSRNGSLLGTGAAIDDFAMTESPADAAAQRRAPMISAHDRDLARDVMNRRCVQPIARSRERVRHARRHRRRAVANNTNRCYSV